MFNVRACFATAVLAALAATASSAQTGAAASTAGTASPSHVSVAPSPAKPIIVNGDVWLKSHDDQRRAFLIGVANGLAIDVAYATRTGTPAPVAAGRAVKALEGMTLDGVASRITHWYEANPTRRDMPVIGVIWLDMVKPDSAHK